MTREIQIFPKRRRYVLLFLQGVLMTGLAIFCIVSHHLDANKPAKLAVLLTLFYPIFWIGLALFGFGAIFFLIQVVQPQLRPILIVNEQGLTDRSSLIALGFIPWEDIKDLTIRPHLGQTYLSVSLVDNAPYLAKMKWLQERVCQANLKMGFPLVNIVLNTSDQTPEQLYQLILSHYGNRFGTQRS